MATINITSKMQVEQLVRNKCNILALAIVIDNNQTAREKDNGLTIKVNNTGWSRTHDSKAEMLRVFRKTKATHMSGAYGVKIRNDDGTPSIELLELLAIPLPRYWRQLSDVWYDTLTMEVIQ